MHYFPLEIWRKVFIQLELSDRLTCTLVCRKWWNILDDTCLLYNVEIRNNENKFKGFINMVKQSPHRAAQVQYLNLYGSIARGFNTREICDIFPSARIINVADSASVTSSSPQFTEQLIMTHSESTVEELKDSGFCELTMQIVNSNMGSRLKRLDLVLQNLRDMSSTVISQLRNMPVLEVLDLNSISMSPMDLEMLHRNLPSIRNLSLNVVAPNVGDIPENITPAGLTKLHYYSLKYENQAALSNWYLYLSRKYIDVKEFNYDGRGLIYITMDAARQVYENGLLQFLQLIGPYSDRQRLCKIPDGINVFEPLDNSDSKIREFAFYGCQGGTLFQFLAQSNQARYVESICLQRTIIGTPDSLQSLTSLTRLEIFLGYFPTGNPIDLTSYLNGFPDSLEQCKITCSDVYVDPKSTNTTNIRYLWIDCKDLTVNLGIVLSNCFPNLVTLSLKGNVTKSVDVNIQSSGFKRAAFLHSRRGSNECVVSFNSGSQTKPQLYVWHPNLIYSIERMDRFLRTFPMLSFTSSAEKKINASYEDGGGFWIEPLDSGDAVDLDSLDLLDLS